MWDTVPSSSLAQSRKLLPIVHKSLVIVKQLRRRALRLGCARVGSNGCAAPRIGRFPVCRLALDLGMSHDGLHPRGPVLPGQGNGHAGCGLSHAV